MTRPVYAEPSSQPAPGAAIASEHQGVHPALPGEGTTSKVDKINLIRSCTTFKNHAPVPAPIQTEYAALKSPD